MYQCLYPFPDTQESSASTSKPPVSQTSYGEILESMEKFHKNNAAQMEKLIKNQKRSDDKLQTVIDSIKQLILIQEDLKEEIQVTKKILKKKYKDVEKDDRESSSLLAIPLNSMDEVNHM